MIKLKSICFKIVVFVILKGAIPCSNIYSQYNSSYSASEIQLALNKLNVLGSVLYIAAHPDDENTSALAYMSKGKLIRTAYLSLTRGDGGQNLLGNEKGDLLGVIRTQELLSARKIDGAQQFFTRAIDFGYSKTPEETLNNWDRNKILEDIVFVIRYFKPDIILTRFSDTQGGHGHHLASAMLAKEAFYAAADPRQFPSQLQKVDAWQTKRLFWNTWLNNPPLISINAGEYNPLLGKTYLELSARARSMHKTQGFGVTPNHAGSQWINFSLTAGDSATNDLFENIDISWNRVAGSEQVQKLVSEAFNNFDSEVPQNSIPILVGLYKELEQLLPNYWAKIKIQEVIELIKMCSGLWTEAIVWEPGVTPGADIDVRYMISARNASEFSLKKIEFIGAEFDTTLNSKLPTNEPFNLKKTIYIPKNAKLTTPYWLKEQHNGKMFSSSYSEENKFSNMKPTLSVKTRLQIQDIQFDFEIPVLHRWNDATQGESYRPFVIYPEVSLELEKSVYLFSENNEKEVIVHIHAYKDNITGDLKLHTPPGWQVTPQSLPFQLQKKGNRKTFKFKIKPLDKSKNGDIQLIAKTGTNSYASKAIEVEYEHIDVQTVLLPASAKAIKLDINMEPRKIGYIMGSGDEIPETLTQLGYQVSLLTDKDLEDGDLSQFDVIICGVRAFNVRDELERLQKRLNKFVADGGTWIVQHNTRFGNQVKQIGPYQFSTTGRDRIAEESAELQMLIPDHTIFNYPNKITEADFDNWLQERGLYFADSWKGKLYPLLAGHDKGEPSKLGGLLYARYGKGVFIFTAYSWFRQLPAGVPGAIRLFVNLVSAKGKA